MAFGVFLAIILAPHYGQSWDDEFDSDTGRTALSAYYGWRSYIDTHDQRYYGPAYFMLSEVGVRLAKQINPAWHPVNVRHVLNFSSFLLSLPALYLISRLLFTGNISLLITSLFATQPLLFGHAFINQKDIPLMTVTLWAFTLGVHAFGNIIQGSELELGSIPEAWEQWALQLRRAWRGLPSFNRLIVTLIVIISAQSVIDLTTGYFALPITTNLIRQMYAGDAWQPLQTIFNLVAGDADKTPLTMYLDRAYRIFLWVRIPIACIILRIDVALLKRVSPSLDHAFQAPWMQIRPIFLAGAVLGLATTLRAPAAFIGVLVVIFVLFKKRSGAILPLVIYAISAFLALYLSWPFMWETPTANFLETLKALSNFAPHPVLFRGELLSSSGLPWHYLPALVGLRLTEPLPLLAILGMGVFIVERAQMQQRIMGTLILAWFTVPAIFIMTTQTPLYGNIRQVLFLLPPLFFFSGFALEKIDALLKHKWMKALLLSVVLIPGILGILRLHPYEYTYFNQYTGGTKGAYTQFDLDYWCTGYREAAEFLNLSATPESVVVVVGPEYAVGNFTRENIRVLPEWQLVEDPDYIVVCETAPLSEYKSDLPIIYTVQRSGAVFTRVHGKE